VLLIVTFLYRTQIERIYQGKKKPAVHIGTSAQLRMVINERERRVSLREANETEHVRRISAKYDREGGVIASAASRVYRGVRLPRA